MHSSTNGQCSDSHPDKTLTRRFIISALLQSNRNAILCWQLSLSIHWSPITSACGDEGIRTPDLVDASHALSQLSYCPGEACSANADNWNRTKDLSFIRDAL